MNLIAAIFLLTLTAALGETYPPPKTLGDVTNYGRNIQRTMRLLATSTADHRNTVRILFYGQSITEQKWSNLVADDLRARFPHANLIIENRALGGFASQMLVKTAPVDIDSFRPDLVIFHVFGAHDKYEAIIRGIRERTTAEILQQNDHVTKPSDFEEETDPAKLMPKGNIWPAFMNHKWLPEVSRKYGTELCDQRGLWKTYLKDYQLQPQALLKDGVHLNPHGEYLMAEFVKAYLRYDPRLGPSPMEQRVRTYHVGQELSWNEGKLRCDFEGNRVDVITRPDATARATILLDGHKPSEVPELYAFTRPKPSPGGKWPVVADIQWQKPLLLEDWTMDITRTGPDEKHYSFTVTGSKTGPDGSGTSDQPFVSNSGRVIIKPDDWNVPFALMLSGVKPVPEHITQKWSVTPRFMDELTPPAPEAGIEPCATVAFGLKNAHHTLEITSSDPSSITALRIYQPPLH